jgi:hypothetical protein
MSLCKYPSKYPWPFDSLSLLALYSIIFGTTVLVPEQSYVSQTKMWKTPTIGVQWLFCLKRFLPSTSCFHRVFSSPYTYIVFIWSSSFRVLSHFTLWNYFITSETNVLIHNSVCFHSPRCSSCQWNTRMIHENVFGVTPSNWAVCWVHFVYYKCRVVSHCTLDFMNRIFMFIMNRESES